MFSPNSIFSRKTKLIPVITVTTALLNIILILFYTKIRNMPLPGIQFSRIALLFWRIIFPQSMIL